MTGEDDLLALDEISISTLKRDWTFAKAWLFSQLNSPS
jgi:hypothetical protein